MSDPILIDARVDFDEDHHSGKQDTLIIKHTQNIPAEFIQANMRDKIDTLHTPMGDFYRVCSIPVAFVEKWQREGFDIHHASIHEILAKLRKEDLDGFITTNKRF